MTNDFLYVVEMQVKKKWLPTTGVTLLKFDIPVLLKAWQERLKDCNFRVVKYVRKDK